MDATTMGTDLRIRPMTATDAEVCGKAAYAAHQDVAARHGFAPEHPSPEFSIGMMNGKLRIPARAAGSPSGNKPSSAASSSTTSPPHRLRPSGL